MEGSQKLKIKFVDHQSATGQSYRRPAPRHHMDERNNRRQAPATSQWTEKGDSACFQCRQTDRQTDRL